MRLRSLRARLLAGVIGVAALGLVVLAAITYVQQRDFLLERADDQAQEAIQAVARALNEQGVPDPGRPGRPGGRGDDRRGPPPPGGPGGPRGRPPLSLPPGVYGERRDASGRTLGSVVLTTGEEQPSPPRLPGRLSLDELITVPAQDGTFDYRVNAAPSGGGTITISAVPLNAVDEQLDELVLVEGAVILGVLLLMAGVGLWVVRLGLRPLDRIGETAGRIAAGDLSHRVEPADERTEIGRLGLSLNAMLGQIEGSFAEKQASEERLRQFLADASHELRTPLASIRGYAELFRMGALEDEEGSEKAMARIEQEAARMGVLVEDLLLLARMDEVRDRVREPVDVAALARDAVDDARATAPDRAIDLELDADPPPVLGDADELRQVLANLLRNALVHTPPGTPVDVAVRSAGGRVELEVRDHGPGLPVDDGEALFERFWRADPARRRGPAGAGLGLAIVAAIVHAHGGEVSAAGAEGGGARFEVVLPAAVSPGSPRRSVPPPSAS
jgi:two-component system, OmpR family, sensor kinase